jgi:ribonuclease P protein component
MRVMRLTRRADFDRTRRQGQAQGTPMCVVIALRRDSGPPRIGVAAGKRIGGAVQRNRAKRVLREGVRSLYPSIAPGWDIVLLARSPVLSAKSTQVTPHLEQAFRRLRVFAAAANLHEPDI